MKPLRLLMGIFVTLSLLSVGACVQERGNGIETSGVLSAHENPKGTALLYVYNISGPTLIASNQDLVDNGKTIVSIPRNTYTTVNIPAGAHVFNPRYRVKPSASLQALDGGEYHIVIGYNPAKGWAFPFAGDSVVCAEISDTEAKDLMAKMTKHPD